MCVIYGLSSAVVWSHIAVLNPVKIRSFCKVLDLTIEILCNQRLFIEKSSWQVTDTIDKKCCNFFLTNMWSVFFLFVFFFSLEKIKLHSLTRFKPCIFFFRRRKKKNTVFLLTHSILDENVTKVIFTRNKKKYGTFGPTMEIIPSKLRFKIWEIYLEAKSMLWEGYRINFL